VLRSGDHLLTARETGAVPAACSTNSGAPQRHWPSKFTAALARDEAGAAATDRWQA